MGLEEVACIISIGGHCVMVVSGQFRPPEGLADIQKTVDQLGVAAPSPNEVSPEFQASCSRFSYPPHLWAPAVITEEERENLRSCASRLTTMPVGFEQEFLEQANRFEAIANSYFALLQSRAEAQVEEAIHQGFAGAYTSADFWAAGGKALAAFQEALNVQYLALFTGANERDTLLRCELWSGNLPDAIRDDCVHFNWRKADLVSHRPRSTTRLLLDHNAVDSSHLAALTAGFKGGKNHFLDMAALIPMMLPRGPYGLLVVGPHRQLHSLANHQTFLFRAARTFLNRFLGLHLSDILTRDREDWRRTARLTGHRVRASLQNMSSQFRTLRDCLLKKQDFTISDYNTAQARLDKAYEDLIAISYATESDIHGSLDVRSAHRQIVRLGPIAYAAIEDQEQLAEDQGIDIQTNGLEQLAQVSVNEMLIRIALINLINNGLKYSYPSPESRRRVLRVQRSNRYDTTITVAIEVVNFGLGIKPEDVDRIFEWETRLAPAQSTFKDRYGKGLGLWEVQHIVRGHGGKVLVDSTHCSKAPVSNDNINQCVTVFTITLPSARIRL